MRFLIYTFIFSLALTACTGAWDHYPENTQSSHVMPQTIANDDSLMITVYGEESLSGEFPVTPTGSITMPLIGDIAVSGLTPQTAAEHIQNAYKQGYLVNPDVTVTVVKTQSFSILGEVLQAGEYPYKNDMTVLQAVAKAEGFSYRANQGQFDIIRKLPDGSEIRMDDALLSTRLHPGDTIRVRERFF